MIAMTQIQQSRQYAQAFGRNVYTDILRWAQTSVKQMRLSWIACIAFILH